MRQKTLNDDEKMELLHILMGYVPENLLENVFSSGKAISLYKYLKDKKDFVLEIEGIKYNIPFSRVFTFSVEQKISKTNQTAENISENKQKNEDDLQVKQANEITENISEKKQIYVKRSKTNRTSLTCLVDEFDVQNLEKLSVSEDVSVSHLVRSAIKVYLKEKLSKNK